MYTLTVCRLSMDQAPRVTIRRGVVSIGPLASDGEPDGCTLTLYSLEGAERLGQALLTAVQAERDFLARHEPPGREMGVARGAARDPDDPDGATWTPF